jgi:peptidoglycan hydrolase-like protein with peptidoglycan-binding domain
LDGRWGSDTTTGLQVVLGMPVVDGIVSRQNAAWEDDNPGLTTGWQWLTSGYGSGSPTILAAQRKLKAAGFYTGKLDGLVGPKFFTGLQQHLTRLGVYDGAHDGEIWKPSSTVSALQRRLNEGKF